MFKSILFKLTLIVITVFIAITAIHSASINSQFSSFIVREEATTSEISSLVQRNSDGISSINERISSVNGATLDPAHLIQSSQSEIGEISQKIAMIRGGTERLSESGANLNDQVLSLDEINRELNLKSEDLTAWTVDIKKLL